MICSSVIKEVFPEMPNLYNTYPDFVYEHISSAAIHKKSPMKRKVSHSEISDNDSAVNFNKYDVSKELSKTALKDWRFLCVLHYYVVSLHHLIIINNFK